MPSFSNYNQLEKAVGTFNKHAYNAGLEFRVASFDNNNLNIIASFDYPSYVNVEIDCKDVIYTNINANAIWQDAWNDDQLFLLTKNELTEIIDFFDIEIPSATNYFGIVFNIKGIENYFNVGTVICTKLHIHWLYPNYNEQYV